MYGREGVVSEDVWEGGVVSEVEIRMTAMVKVSLILTEKCSSL